MSNGPIWLAEDDPDLRALVARLLRSLELQVREFAAGDELLVSLEDQDVRPPALIVTDHHLPGRLGLDCMAALREAGHEIPFIVITAFGDQETHRRAAELGAARIFDKPFNLRALAGEVERILGR